MKSVKNIKSLPEKTKKIVPVLSELKSGLKKIYGERLNRLILFGSYARGDSKEYSDIDVMVVLSNMNSPFDEINTMSDVKQDLILKYDIVISTIPTSISRYRRWKTPLILNVKKEGLII